jgi:DNA-binding transcriptional MerR regulator
MEDVMNTIYYSIKEVSERLDITYRTLHYYEKKFNLQINRDKSGSRIYREEDIDLLEKILDLKDKGMTLDGIKSLFEEKGVLDNEDDNKSIALIDEEDVDVKEIIINEIKLAVSKELEDTKNTLNEIVEDNKALRKELRELKRANEDHYKKIDNRLTEWRNSSYKPWWKKIFK